LGKIFVLGYDGGMVLQGVLPNDRIFGFTQADLAHGLDLTASLPQNVRQGSRKLSVDDQLHAACSTA
jgi:hypothetical protein